MAHGDDFVEFVMDGDSDEEMEEVRGVGGR